jgi:prevent-host-death family protein
MRQIGAYEAKTHLTRLLNDVAAGETITITRHGQPVATLGPARTTRSSAVEAARGLRMFRRAHRLRGVRIRELIDEGRRP